MRRVSRADLMLLVTVVLWGFNVTVTKYVLEHGFRPLAYSAVRYGEEKMELLDRLGHASSKAEDSPPESRARPGWERLPSAAPASDPLPDRRA